jgi:hypothetical protein
MLTPEGKLLYLYCITTVRGSASGVYRVTERQIAFDTGLDEERVGGLLKGLKKMDVEWYPETETVWVKNFLRRQIRNPSFLLKAAEDLEHGVDSELVLKVVEYNREHGIEIPCRQSDGRVDAVCGQSGSRVDTECVQSGDRLAPDFSTLLYSSVSPLSSEREGVGEETPGAPDGAPAPAPDELPEMTPLEDELHNLQAWGEFTTGDRAWLEELLRDYPGALERDIRDCRDHWMSHAKKHSRNEWKRRLRTWMRRKKDFGGGNGANQQGNRAYGQPGNQPSGAFDGIQGGS